MFFSQSSLMGMCWGCRFPLQNGLAWCPGYVGGGTSQRAIIHCVPNNSKGHAKWNLSNKNVPILLFSLQRFSASSITYRKFFFTGHSHSTLSWSHMNVKELNVVVCLDRYKQRVKVAQKRDYVENIHTGCCRYCHIFTEIIHLSTAKPSPPVIESHMASQFFISI